MGKYVKSLLHTDNVQWLLCQQNEPTTNLHLHDEQMVNGLGKITWASVFCFQFEAEADIYIYIYIYIYVCMYVCTYIYVYVHVYVHICIRRWISICTLSLYVYVYIFIYGKRN
jgi:hypothetical protein